MGQALHDVDAFALCRAAAARALRDFGSFLRADQVEELNGFLLVTLVELAGAFRNDGGGSFERYASALLRKRTVDWYRHELGDSRSRSTPTRRVSLEEMAMAERLPSALIVASLEDSVLDRLTMEAKPRRRT